MKKIDNNNGEASIVTNNYYCNSHCKNEFNRLKELLDEKELLIVGLTDILDFQAKALGAFLPEYQAIMFDKKRGEFTRNPKETDVKIKND